MQMCARGVSGLPEDGRSVVERLKILFITSSYPTKEGPTLGVFVREHARAAALRDDVIVLHCRSWAGGSHHRGAWGIEKETDEAITEGIPTYRVYSARWAVPGTSYLLFLWSIFRAFRRIVAGGFRPDVIHAHSYVVGVAAAIIAKLYGIPLVITEHSSAFLRKSLAGLEVSKARLAFRLAKVVMPVSGCLQRAIESTGIRARFRVLPNVVDTALFRPNLARRDGREPKRILVVCLFSSGHTKGLPDLLNALRGLGQRRDDWRLDVVGDGPVRGQYAKLARDLGLDKKVTFHGQKPKQEVAEFMRQASLVVVSSPFETFSVVAAEALATGTPVLATRCGGPEEFVTNKVGLLVPKGDADALCEGLDYMLDNLSSFLPAELCRHATERFSPERVGQMLHSVYKACSRRRRVGHGPT